MHRARLVPPRRGRGPPGALIAPLTRRGGVAPGGTSARANGPQRSTSVVGSRARRGIRRAHRVVDVEVTPDGASGGATIPCVFRV
ncbi:hypothetical protein FTX61_13040 [Nitriliruptoraceae bacterium ZYF776]|nr:hypothetical protein [Profundirhabdus halotolerans]